MYPLVVIYASAIWNQDEGHRKYSHPLAVCGFVISVYHNLLYYNLVADSLVPCSEGVSCTTKQLELFGFLTIPLMAFISFSLICLIEHLNILNRRYYDEK